MGNNIKIKKSAADKALRSAKTYEKNVQKGTEKKYSEADKALDDIKKFLNKNGTISKTKTKSKKAKAAFNEAVAKYNSIAASKKLRQKNLYERNVSGAAESLKKQGHFSGAGSEEKARRAAEIFQRKTKPAFKQFSWSEAVLILTDSGFDEAGIDDIMDYLSSQLNFDTPDEMQVFRSDDDITVFLDHVANLRSEAEDMGCEYSTSEYILMANRMLEYGFDDYESTLEDWDDGL